MKRSHLLKHVLFVAAFAAAMWQFPRLIEKVDSLRQGMSLGGASGADADTPATLNDIRAINEQLASFNQQRKPALGNKVVIYGGKSEAMSPEEQQRLMDEAERMRNDSAFSDGGKRITVVRPKDKSEK